MRTEAARNLGINASMLGRWVREFQADENDSFRGNGKLTREQDELRRLSDENRRLKHHTSLPHIYTRLEPLAAGGQGALPARVSLLSYPD
ncbi:transposase [Marinobacterium sedimentorum]|uniref:transposase n=1 Tax=Marinobacterium sedimentorum TaxID=2927804 RepID=UPI003F65C77E